MKWKEIKELLEKKGLKDDDEIGFIDSHFVCEDEVDIDDYGSGKEIC